MNSNRWRYRYYYSVDARDKSITIVLFSSTELMCVSIEVLLSSIKLIRAIIDLMRTSIELLKAKHQIDALYK